MSKNTKIATGVIGGLILIAVVVMSMGGSDGSKGLDELVAAQNPMAAKFKAAGELTTCNDKPVPYECAQDIIKVQISAIETFMAEYESIEFAEAAKDEAAAFEEVADRMIAGLEQMANAPDEETYLELEPKVDMPGLDTEFTAKLKALLNALGGTLEDA